MGVLLCQITLKKYGGNIALDICVKSRAIQLDPSVLTLQVFGIGPCFIEQD